MIDVKSVKLWISLAAQLKSVKKQELDLRKEINSVILGEDKAGTKHAAFGLMEVTCSVSERIVVKKEDILSNIESLTEEDKQCIIWKPSIVKNSYDKLPPGSILRRLTTLTLGAPTIKAHNLEVPE